MIRFSFDISSGRVPFNNMVEPSCLGHPMKNMRVLVKLEVPGFTSTLLFVLLSCDKPETFLFSECDASRASCPGLLFFVVMLLCSTSTRNSSQYPTEFVSSSSTEGRTCYENLVIHTVTYSKHVPHTRKRN